MSGRAAALVLLGAALGTLWLGWLPEGDGPWSTALVPGPGARGEEHLPVLRAAIASDAPPSGTGPTVRPEPAPPARARHGIVRDPTGTPIVGAAVWFPPARPPDPTVSVVLTDRDGRFAVPAWAHRAERLVVGKDDWETHRRPWPPAARGDRTEVTLRRLPVLEGAVWDARGEPAGYLQVEIHRLREDGSVGSRIASESMSSSGRWRYAVNPGRYQVAIAGRTADIATRVMEARRGAPTRWDLVLPGGVFARGTLELPPALRDREIELVLHVARPGSAVIDAEDGDCDDDVLDPGDRAFRLQVPPDDAPYWLVVRERSRGRRLPLWVGGPYRGARADWTVRVPEDAAQRSTLQGRTWIVEPLEDDEDPEDEEAPQDEDADDRSALDVARKTPYTIGLEDARGFRTGLYVYGGASDYRFTRVPAGRYTLRVTGYPGRELLCRTLDVEGGEVIDLAPLVVR